MANKLLYEYKQIYSFNNRYFKHFHKWKLFLTFLIMLITWGGMYWLTEFRNVTIPSFVPPLPMLFILPTFCIEIERVVKKVHKMNSVKDYNEKCKRQFLNRVKMNKIDIHNKEQMNMLFTIIDTEIKELKPNFFLSRGIVAGLFAPLWINYISSIYNNEVANWQDATYILLLFSTILVMLLIIGYQVKQIFYDDIINSDYKKLKDMNNLLKSVYITSLNTKLDI